MPLRLFVVKPVEERERELRHPVVDAIRARPEYLPDAASLTQPLHRWRRADLAPFLPALRRVAPPPAARPRARARAPRSRQALRDRRTPLLRPAQDLRQGAAAGDRARRPRCSPRPTSATCTRTSRTARPRSPGTPRASPACRSRFTGHARDIYAEHLNPKGWLRRKLLAARFVVTCTEANVAPPARDRARGARSTSSTTGSTPTSRGCSRERRATRPAAQRRTLRVLAVGRHGRQEGLRRARRRLRASCAAAASPFEAAIVGQEDKHSRRGPRADRAPRPRAAACALPGPMGQDELLARVPPRERAVHAQPPARPTTATASRTCSSRRWRPARRSSPARCPASPSWSSTRSTALLVAPEDPEALADALVRLHGDPALRARARRARPRDGRAALRRRRGTRAGSPSCSRRRSP